MLSQGMWRWLFFCSTKTPDDIICVKIDFTGDRQTIPDRVTYKLIREYIEKQYEFKLHAAYIAEVKRKLGLTTYPAPNAAEKRECHYYSVPPHKAGFSIMTIMTVFCMIVLADSVVYRSNALMKVNLIFLGFVLLFFGCFNMLSSYEDFSKLLTTLGSHSLGKINYQY